ncbi:MAG: DNA-3-methyladenine glycosylase [Bacteroidales bacterium]|nr:DNA-3-methyladenine glycosylase [Bacteroidales bacterium]
MSAQRLSRSFYTNDVLDIAPHLPGKFIVMNNGHCPEKYIITEVEAYRGEEDLACHASKGRTRRNEIMYADGGHIYVYLIYGMYWMLNFVTGKNGNPQALLIRSVEGYNGPGVLSRKLGIDGSYYGEDLVSSDRIWIEDSNIKGKIVTRPRIGVDYAGEYWKSKPWRFVMNLQI